MKRCKNCGRELKIGKYSKEPYCDCITYYLEVKPFIPEEIEDEERET